MVLSSAVLPEPAAKWNLLNNAKLFSVDVASMYTSPPLPVIATLSRSMLFFFLGETHSSY